MMQIRTIFRTLSVMRELFTNKNLDCFDKRYIFSAFIDEIRKRCTKIKPNEYEKMTNELLVKEVIRLEGNQKKLKGISIWLREIIRQTAQTNLELREFVI